MELDTSLKYRNKGINKAAREIRRLSINSGLFVDKKSFYNGFEGLLDDIDPADKDKKIGVRSLFFFPKKELEKELIELYGEPLAENKIIDYSWVRELDYESNEWVDVWKLNVSGLELCHDYLLGLHGHKDYESCKCPDKFKEYCKEVNSILIKYTFKI